MSMAMDFVAPRKLLRCWCLTKATIQPPRIRSVSEAMRWVREGGPAIDLLSHALKGTDTRPATLVTSGRRRSRVLGMVEVCERH